MISLLTTAMLTVASPAPAGGAPIAVEPDVRILIRELSAEVAGSERASTSSLLDATAICDTLLSRQHDFSPTERGWTIRLQVEDFFVLTRSGILIMHRPAMGGSPESCGVVAIPAESYDQIRHAFSVEYGPYVATNETRGTGLYPTSTISTDNYVYRLRDAETPKSALSIVVRHKE